MFPNSADIALEGFDLGLTAFKHNGQFVASPVLPRLAEFVAHPILLFVLATVV